jgi:hypothetical protein
MEECLFKGQNINLSLISKSSGYKIKSATIIVVLGKDSPEWAVSNATTSCVTFVRLISPELAQGARNDLLASMLNAANQNKKDGKSGDVIKRVGNIEYSMNALLFVMLTAKVI